MFKANQNFVLKYERDMRQAKVGTRWDRAGIIGNKVAQDGTWPVHVVCHPNTSWSTVESTLTPHRNTSKSHFHISSKLYQLPTKLFKVFFLVKCNKNAIKFKYRHDTRTEIMAIN